MEPFRIVEDLLSRKTDVMQERYDLAVEEQLDSQEINFHKINLKESLAQLTILRTYVN